MLQSTLLKRISSSKFGNFFIRQQVCRLSPRPILDFTYFHVNCIQPLGIKLSSLRDYWLKASQITIFTTDLVLRTLISTT
jgi:hypothetical protein